MSFEVFLIMMLAGVLTGWLGRFVMKDGGYGLMADLFLGLVGSSAASVMWALGVALDTGGGGWTAVVAFVGAATVIVAQRSFARPRV